MNVIGAMLTILMDDIKDAKRIAEYVIEAVSCNRDAEAEWFTEHARSRYDKIVADYGYIVRYAELQEKEASGDPVSAALHGYLEDQMRDLRHLMDDL